MEVLTKKKTRVEIILFLEDHLSQDTVKHMAAEMIDGRLTESESYLVMSDHYNYFEHVN